jgi:hypothetical protein
VALYRLAKAGDSVTAGSCPALYGTSDPARMIGQGKVLDSARHLTTDPAWMIWTGPDLSPAETRELIELEADETAVAIPAGTVLRRIAEYTSEHGDGKLSALLEAFSAARGHSAAQTPAAGPDAGETAVAIPAETVLRSVAKYATEHGDDNLPGHIEAFLAERGL